MYKIVGKKENFQKRDLTYMNTIKKREMERVIPYLKKSWSMQNNKNDRETKFIYQAKEIEDILYEYNKYKNFDLNYAMHRFYNFVTSQQIEHIFCNYENCYPEKNEKHKKIDFYLWDIPIDLKVSSFPKAFKCDKKDFNSDREYRNALIKWMYANQSKEGRNLNQNRIFVVCKYKDGKDSFMNLHLKKEFFKIDQLINRFMTYYSNKKEKEIDFFNQVRLDNGDLVYSEVILLEEQNI